MRMRVCASGCVRVSSLHVCVCVSASLRQANLSRLLPSTINTQTLMPEEPASARSAEPPSLREGITPDSQDSHVIIHGDKLRAAPPSLPRALARPETKVVLANESKEYSLTFWNFVSFVIYSKRLK